MLHSAEYECGFALLEFPSDCPKAELFRRTSWDCCRASWFVVAKKAGWGVWLDAQRVFVKAECLEKCEKDLKTIVVRSLKEPVSLGCIDCLSENSYI